MIEWENKIIAYVNGDLSEKETNTLMKQIKVSEELQNILKTYQNINSEFVTHKSEKPSSRLSNNFEDYIKHVQDSQSNITVSNKLRYIKPLMRYAAILVIVIAASITLWKEITPKESREQNDINAILSDMKTKSDTEKIKTLYINNVTEDNQSKIKKVLIASLKNDKSSNVRLASVETLVEYIDDDLVRSSLIRALGEEEDPQVQVAIIMALSESKNMEIIKPLEEIINKEGGYKFVKDEAHIGIMNFTSI